MDIDAGKRALRIRRPHLHSGMIRFVHMLSVMLPVNVCLGPWAKRSGENRRRKKREDQILHNLSFLSVSTTSIQNRRSVGAGRDPRDPGELHGWMLAIRQAS